MYLVGRERGRVKVQAGEAAGKGRSNSLNPSKEPDVGPQPQDPEITTCEGRHLITEPLRCP